MKVIFLPEVEDYLFELIQILYNKEYFGFPESAVRYVEEFVTDITNNLPQRQSKPAPPYFNLYGNAMSYTAFPKSKNTVWYVFYNTYEAGDSTVFLVRYISNNHRIGKYL